jgi:GNAT superfamily N-acetyltransferase
MTRTSGGGLVLAAVWLDDPLARRLEAEALAEYAMRGEDDQTPHPAALLAPPRGLLVMAWLDGKAAGCGGWYLVEPAAIAVLTRVYVRPVVRRRGTGAAVLAERERTAAEAGARYAWAETGTEAPEAMGLYTRHGYSMVFPPPDRQTRSRAFVRRLP